MIVKLAAITKVLDHFEGYAVPYLKLVYNDGESGDKLEASKSSK